MHKMYSDDILSQFFNHRSPQWRRGSASIFKNWLLNAWKCTQITLYHYYLIIGAPGGGWVVPELLEIGPNMLEVVLIDFLSLSFDHRSPR